MVWGSARPSPASATIALEEAKGFHKPRLHVCNVNWLLLFDPRKYLHAGTNEYFCTANYKGQYL
jgi:hypothetical protein